MILPHEIVADNFAGGGGASTGIARAIGREVDIAVNHDRVAVAMHTANHPHTRHFCEDVWRVDPVEVCGDRPVGLVWFSPDCCHHSKAKGGKPRSKKIRGLAWVVIRWARAVRPRIICLENVEEFEDWGPLDNDGQPDPKRAGRTFRMWVGKLRALGYKVEWRQLVAADFGAPTTRKRLYLVARCDGQPIVWPTPTHGKGRARPWRAAHEVIDFSLPCPSIFGRKKPLAEATLRRIAAGVQRYVIGAARPFIVPTARGLISPTLIQTGYGERDGQAPRVPGLDKPLGTVVAGGAKHALVAAFLTKHYGGVVGHGLERPIGTVTTQDHHSLTTATLAQAGVARVRAFLEQYGERVDTQGDLFAPRRDGLVMVNGEPYEIADISMRMLAPRELFNAQGFPRDYMIDLLVGDRPITKTEQIAKAGNAVCPVMAEAIVAANTRPALRPERFAEACA